MPKANEFAEIIVGGEIFSTWETVRVELDFMDMAWRKCDVSITEADGSTVKQWSTLRIKPGDECQVKLAGVDVIQKGVVFQRQASYDANHHGVLITVGQRLADYVHSTIARKDSQYRDKTFEDIAKTVLKPFGFNLKMDNAPTWASKKFKDVSANPGETAHSFIERLARARGMFVRDNAAGDVVVGVAAGGGSAAMLREGVNIKICNCLIRDDQQFSKIAAVGQLRGDDQTNGEPSRKPAATVDGNSKRHRPLDVLAEEPGDSEDMKNRVEHERNIMLGNIIEATVQVQGWLKPGGGLWDVGESVSIYSPMALLDHDLSVKTVVFQQDSPGGTYTTLSLVRPEALGQIAKPGITANPGASVLPGGTASEGQAEP